MYFDRSGQPITSAQWAVLTKSERVLGNDLVIDTQVTTVFVGLDTEYAVAPNTYLPPERRNALIFETAASNGKGWLVLGRYRTESEAREGHKRIVEELSR